MSTQSYNRRRENLMKKNPYCNWCGKFLIYTKKNGGVLPNNYPTLDHLNDRFLKKRPCEHFTIVLSCPPCNVNRSMEIVRKHKIKNMYKSGAFPFPFNWLGKLLRYFRKRKLLR